MKDFKDMTVDELIATASEQYEISGNAQRIARNCEHMAVRQFLEEHDMSDSVVLHKPTGKRGYLRIDRDYRGLLVDFYPLKKNGEESMRKSEECTEWIACRGLKKNFEYLLTVYEPVKE